MAPTSERRRLWQWRSFVTTQVILTLDLALTLTPTLIAGDDIRKQMELCKGLMQQFAVEDPGAKKVQVLLRGLSKKDKRAARKELKSNTKATADRAEMVETIMSGIACFFDELKMDHEGRYTHEARVAQQVLPTAIMSQAKEGMATLIGTLVHCDRHILMKALNPTHNLR